jgi:concanavalin A-like lectin/glucanase superfamily protein
VHILLRLTAAALLVLAVTTQTASAATLKGDYRFEGTLGSSCCGAPPLTDLGPNSFATETVGSTSRTVLRFPLSSGVSLPAGVIAADSYSIAVQFRLEEITGFRRLVDLSTSTSDRGLYNLSGQLNFYPIATGSTFPAPIQANEYAHVVLTRDAAGEVRGYVDGNEEIGFTDSFGDAVFPPGTDVRFFKDDAVVGGEESAGAVARIRVYDGALTPAEVADISGKTLADLPRPEVGEDVNLDTASGRVLVAVPSSAARASGPRASQKGLTFVPLEQARQVPVGSFLDTRRGTVQMVSATGSGGRTQSAKISAGLFQVFQSRSRRAKGLTQLRLKGASFRRCGARGSRDASAAGLSRRTIRRLRANARGRFQTRGRNSSATVRGTIWTTTDRCDGTLTSVRRGKVVVRDFRRKRNITLTAGKSYLARAR